MAHVFIQKGFNMIRFAAAGFMCIDHYVQFEDRSYVTGNGVDVLFNLLDMRDDIIPAIVAAISDDDFGRWAMREFESRGFDMSRLDIIPGGDTTVYELLLTEDGDRVHHHVRPGVFKEYEFPRGSIDYLKNCGCIHTDLTGKLIPHLPEIAAAGTKIFFDFSKYALTNPAVQDILPHIECGLASFENDIEGGICFAQQAVKAGAKLMITTFGEQGSAAFDGKQLYRAGICPVENVVNTVGAGDSFFAGFIARYLDGAPVDLCLKSGAARAAQVIQTWKPYLE